MDFGKVLMRTGEQHARLASAGLDRCSGFGNADRVRDAKRQCAPCPADERAPGWSADARLSHRLRLRMGRQPPEGRGIGRRGALAGAGAAGHADRLYERPDLLLSRTRRRKPRLPPISREVLSDRREAFGNPDVVPSIRDQPREYVWYYGKCMCWLRFPRRALPASGGCRVAARGPFCPFGTDPAPSREATGG